METTLYYFFGILILLNLLILFNLSTNGAPSTIPNSFDSTTVARLEALLKEVTNSNMRGTSVLSATTTSLAHSDLNNAPQYAVKSDACKRSLLFGRPHHGGWLACAEALPTNCIVYSYGLGADWSFDNALEQAGCEIHGFDPSGNFSFQ